MTTYANYSEFTLTYSVKGVSEAEINSQWLPHGALRVNESLGGVYTIPFSSNNVTAKDLSIQFGYLGLLMRTRNPGDSDELRNYLHHRITDIRCGNSPMILTDGTALYPDNASAFEAWSNTEKYNPVFDMRDSQEQRIDPDLIDDIWDKDT